MKKGNVRHNWSETQLLDAARFYVGNVPGVTLMVVQAFSGIPRSTLSYFFRKKLNELDPELSRAVKVQKAVNKQHGCEKRKAVKACLHIQPFGLNGIA